LRRAILAIVVAGIALAAWNAREIAYLLQLGRVQAELLWGRVPFEQVRGQLTEEQAAKLDQIEEVKVWGESIGLQPTRNYTRINPTWDYRIYNLTACDELSFTTKTWWFPIVGRVPYLGFFSKYQAEQRGEELAAKGFDTSVRQAGAYSTLGWFEDPVMLRMLDWSDTSLAETVLHELAHATLWIPGSVPFNESFANFVGRVSAERWMLETWGEHDRRTIEHSERLWDRKMWNMALRDLVSDLKVLYASDLSADAMRDEKRALLAALPARVAAQPMLRPAGWVAAAERGTWNNASLSLYQTYNTAQDDFQRLLDGVDGDLLAFMKEVERITSDASNPFEALATATPGGECPEI